MIDPFSMIFPVLLPVPPRDRHLKGRDKVRALSRIARRALAQSCTLSGLHLPVLPKDDKGVPLPVDGVHWSLSHKPDVVGGVASMLPIGLDLETMRPVNDALLAKIAGDEEWQLADGRRLETFFRYWTAKEAVLKAVGKGIAGLSRCRVRQIHDDSRMTLIFDGHPWPVEHVWLGQHLAAVTTHQLDVHWTLFP